MAVVEEDIRDSGEIDIAKHEADGEENFWRQFATYPYQIICIILWIQNFFRRARGEMVAYPAMSADIQCDFHAAPEGWHP